MIKKHFKVIVIAIAISALVIFSQNSINASKNALETCLNILLPSLFPFFVMSRLFTLSGGPEILKKIFSPLIRFLFGINGNGATPFILGIISGYPVGAQSTCELYEKKLISKSEAENLLCFCNNSGPLFIIGAVGIGMFKSKEIGLLLYITHIFSAILTGIVLRKISTPNQLKTSTSIKNIKYENIFTQAVEKSVSTTLNIFGYVIFFAVIMDILKSLGTTEFISSSLRFLNIPQDVINACICSVIEITMGIKKLSECDYPLSMIIVLCASIIGWGGISVHAQVKSIISKTNLSFKKYIFGKMIHSFISFICAGITFTLFPISVQTFSGISINQNANNDTSAFFIIISFLVLLGYIVKYLSVKPPYRRCKNSCKNSPQCINSK